MLKLRELKLRGATDTSEKGSNCACEKLTLHHTCPGGTSFLQTFESHLGSSSLFEERLTRGYIESWGGGVKKKRISPLDKYASFKF